jgi:tetratricopeptide (TPR) repeat protein
VKFIKQGLARVFERQAKNPESLKCLQKCLQLNPDNRKALYWAAWMHFMVGDHRHALDILLPLRDDYQSDARYYYRLGRVYWELGEQYRRDKQYCFELFIKSAQLDPTLDDPFVHLGHFYRQVQADLDRARKCYQKAFSLNPGNQQVARLLADLYTQEFNDPAAAFAVHRTVAEHDIRANWAWRNVGLYQMV